jgi:N-acetylneuraminic acid mutarotase
MGQWRWMGGSSKPGSCDSNTGDYYAPGVYGRQGVYSASNVPGSKGSAVSWSDASGNLWLFGGQRFESAGSIYWNDLWEYCLTEWETAPVITSAAAAGFVVGTSGSFTVTVTGTPTPTLSESGILPAGVTFDSASGVLSGTAAPGIEGLYPITFVAANSPGNYTIQYFALTVGEVPVITSADSAFFTEGTPGSFTLTATGGPTLKLTESGKLPRGVSFDSKADVLSGFPSEGTAGSYPITFTASTDVPPDATQSFTLTVAPAPAGWPGGQWRWMGGSNTIPPDPDNPTWRTGQPGVYGTQGVYAPGDIPGARNSAVSRTDASGNLWLFGGFGYESGNGWAGYLNDFWEFNPSKGQWRWMGGSSTVQPQGWGGIYGTLGVYAPGNIPGAGGYGNYAASWTDASGDLWLFGGGAWCPGGISLMFNDLWEYNPPAGQWRWMGPMLSTDVDCSWNYYAPGIYGTQGVYDVGNIPGARDSAVSWTDANSNLWLFGGSGFDSAGNWGGLNDLWEYNPSLGQWRWMGGSSTLTTTDSFGNYYAPGVYGTQGVYAFGNIPGARDSAVSWTDANGNFWLFGGYGYDSAGNESQLNDLWEYNPAVGQWRWMDGSSTLPTDSFGNYDASGVYGTQGVYSAGNVPGSRSGAVSWSDASGNLWLFGGEGYDSAGTWAYLNDLWEFNPNSGEWRWVSGGSTISACGSYPFNSTGNCGQAGIYGKLGAYAYNATPGARASAASWTDANGNFWLFGGFGLDLAGTAGDLNDLWEYTLSVKFTAITSAGSATFTVGTAGSFTVTAIGYPSPALSESGTLPSGVTFDADTGMLSGTPTGGVAGRYPVTFTASNGAGNDATQSFILIVDAAAAPVITGMSPAVVQEGSQAFTLTVTGNNFGSGATVLWNGSGRSTTWVSATELTAAINAADLAAVGTAKLRVANPASLGGAASANFKFAIDTPEGTPGSFTVGSTSTTLNLQPGQNTQVPVTFTGTAAGAAITATCANLPAGVACGYSNGVVTLTSSASALAGTYTITVIFTATQHTAAAIRHGHLYLATGFALTGLPLGLLWIGGSRKKTVGRGLILLSGLLLVLLLVGCGSQGTSPPTSTKTQTSMALTLTVS